VSLLPNQHCPSCEIQTEEPNGGLRGSSIFLFLPGLNRRSLGLLVFCCNLASNRSSADCRIQIHLLKMS
jgi:hypothetical protein